MAAGCEYKGEGEAERGAVCVVQGGGRAAGGAELLELVAAGRPFRAFEATE
jgi:hypothetical protein